jgi:hypothetical protein
VARDPVAIGSAVAAGFIDEDRVIVGSHSGVGRLTTSTTTGTRATRRSSDIRSLKERG